MGRGSQTRETRRVQQITYLQDKVADQAALIDLYRNQHACQVQMIKNLEQINQAQQEMITVIQSKLDSLE